MHGEHDDPDQWEPRRDTPRDLDAVTVGKGEVEQHHVGLDALEHAPQLGRRASFADDVDPGGRPEDEPQTLANEVVVLDDDHRDVRRAMALTVARVPPLAPPRRPVDERVELIVADHVRTSWAGTGCAAGVEGSSQGRGSVASGTTIATVLPDAPLVIESRPPMLSARSRIPARPSPSSFAVGSPKPTPSSEISTRRSSPVREMETPMCRALACRVALASASWTMRNRSISAS